MGRGVAEGDWGVKTTQTNNLTEILMRDVTALRLDRDWLLRPDGDGLTCINALFRGTASWSIARPRYRGWQPERAINTKGGACGGEREYAQHWKANRSDASVGHDWDCRVFSWICWPLTLSSLGVRVQGSR